MRTEPPTGDELTRLLVSMKRNVLEQVAHEQASPKRSPLADRVIGVILGVALLLGLGAGAAFALGIVPPPLGAPSDAAPVSTPTSTPMPTATPPSVGYEVVPGQPASRYGLECETLIDESLVAGLFTTEVGPADPIVTAAGIGISIPRRTSILSEGGTVCEWSNGVPANDQYSVGPDYVGVTVSVVPRPVEGWSERAVRYGMPSDWSQCTDYACRASAAVGDAWVAVEAFGGEPDALDPSGWQLFLDAVTEAVSAAGPAAAPVMPERTHAPLPSNCVVLPLGTIESITSSREVELQNEGGGWSEWAEARDHAGNHGCHWSDGDGHGVASVGWVRDGRWAYLRMLDAGTASPLELAGLSRDDKASIRCDDRYGSHCAVDLALGPDWINVVGGDRAMAIALAEAVLVQLAP